MERKKVLVEVKKQLKLALPLILANGLQFFLQTISNMFVGHLGELALSGASLATCFAGVTGYSLMTGMATALDTLCGQAYGAKQYRMLGINLQRAMVVLTLVSIPVATMWAFTSHILKALRQDHQIAEVAGIYARWMIPSLFGYSLLQCYNKFLQTQNIVLPLLLSSCFTALLHILICWILVFKLSFGSKGGALAISLSYWINVLLLAVYVRLSPACKITWTGFSKKAFHGIYNFLTLAIPSAGMICLEFWAFEALVLLAGILPNPKLATSVAAITLNTVAVVAMISIGLGATASTRVSNELGASNSQAASFAIFVVVSITIVEGVTMGAILLGIRSMWGHAYSNEGEVIKQVATVMPFLALFHLIDGIQAAFSGAARGCGWQKICVFINLASYYVLGIPLSVLAAFVLHLGTKGLWIGMICAVFVQASLLIIITLRTDWKMEVNKASDRVNESSIPIKVDKASDKVNESSVPIEVNKASDKVNESFIPIEVNKANDKVNESSIKHKSSII